ncbi:PAAR domain-containing protein [Gallaecimonas mangrovi]|uniref:PAAR domain-containing protein n=1 Tax=Gallaecimonas mangrovi TaxID=2291597 RepID=UPI000E205689|nr:PAAR domain-containing protein [Gallaecimonas mangrovi]
MGKPAATITHMHVCPKTTGTVPHVGGPIVTGSGNVLIGSLPAARVGDTLVCVGPPDKVKSGSGTVLINGKKAARMGDSTDHGGAIVVGNPTVLIGG